MGPDRSPEETRIQPDFLVNIMLRDGLARHFSSALIIIITYVNYKNPLQ